jgi:hypothetical protein
MEFIMMLIIVLMIAITLSWVAYYYITDYSERRNMNDVQDLGNSLQNEVILAYHVAPGYVRSIVVPATLDSYPVNISGTSNEIILTYKNNDVLFRIPAVSGQFIVGKNTIQKLTSGSVKIN